MKKLLLILLSLPMMILGQTSYVPDDNFEAYLEQNGMGDGIPNNDQVLTSNINLVTMLDVNDEIISDLTGIEDFAALQYLECGDNELTTLDVSQNTALTELYCGYNELISLNVSGAPLQSLVCNSNELAMLDVSQNTNLTALYCMNNNLASLDVSQLSSLADLVCTNNNLTILDISGASSLTYILCEGNLLSSLDVSDASPLNYLDCSDNQLTSLDLRNGNNLYLSAFTSANNPNLYCISVDDPVYSTANWTLIDSWTSFGNQCTPLACTPDPQYVSAGLYPLALADAGVGSQYNEAITIITPLDTTVDYLGTTMVLNVIDVTLDSVVGLPPGFSYSCDASSCSIPGGSSGCLSIYSTINPTISDTGLYQIDIYTTTTVDAGVMGTISSQDVVDSYSIRISQLGCTDSLAYNYDPLAVVDDGSCTICSASSTGLTFTKQDNADWHQASNRDIITPTCELTRGQSGGIFNYATQVDVYDNNGNENIKYAMGTYDNYSSPWFSYFNQLGNYTSTAGMSSLAGETVTIHILDDDVYFELEFNSWSSGQQGGFSYTRSDACNEVLIVYGCTDPTAPNYNSSATGDDGSCIYYGCTDPTAPNYDPTATVDDQSCIDCSIFTSSITLSNYNGYNIVCYGDDDDATAEVSGGVGPYSYSWSTGSTYVTSLLSSTEIVVPGSYSVTITDNDGCQTSESFIVIGPATPVQSSVSVTSNYNGQDISCNGASDGEATVSVFGGTPGYTYSWNTNPIQSTNMATGLLAGSYTCLVTDANGCSTLETFSISEPAMIDPVAISSMPVSCNSFSDGEATVSVVGGTPGYTYTWDDPTNQTTQTATGLSSGSYTCLVTDANGCIAPTGAIAITISEPDLLVAIVQSVIDVSCTGDATGAITLSTTGGTGTYSYLWSNGQTSATATGLSLGTYTCTVTDANGCAEITVPITISEPASALAVSITVLSDETCNGSNDASVIANVSGGVGPYTYSWSNAATSDLLSGLSAGVYTVEVTDGNGCLASSTTNIISFSVLNVLTSYNSPTCNSTTIGVADDGTATVNVAGGAGGYTYLWDDALSQTTPTASDLTAGTYNCEILDANGCAASAQVIVSEPSADITATFTNTDIACFGASTGASIINAIGGTAPLDYSWSPATSNSTDIQNQVAGTYVCNVSDVTGCITQFTTTISESPLLVSNNIISSCDSALIGNTYYTISGWYPDTLTSVNGCDSIVNTTLTINNSTSNTTSITDCDEYIWPINGAVYNISETYTDVSTNSSGCTHTEILLLTINQSTSSYDTLSVAASIVWNGMPLNASGDYSVILTNSVGCDSITNLNLTVTIPSGLFNVTNSDKSLLMITDMLGQETPYRRNTPLFYIYDDGTVEKRVVID